MGLRDELMVDEDLICTVSIHEITAGVIENNQEIRIELKVYNTRTRKAYWGSLVTDVADWDFIEPEMGVKRVK